MRGGTPPSYFVMTWMAAERGVRFLFNNFSYFFVIKWLTKRNIFVFKNLCKLHILSWKLQNCGYWDLSLLCINLKINLIFILSPEKCIQFNQSRTDNQLSGNLKYCARILWENSHLLEYDWNIHRERKRRIYSRKLKVSTLNIEIKRSGLWVSNSKVPSLEH